VGVLREDQSGQEMEVVDEGFYDDEREKVVVETATTTTADTTGAATTATIKGATIAKSSDEMYRCGVDGCEYNVQEQVAESSEEASGVCLRRRTFMLLGANVTRCVSTKRMPRALLRYTRRGCTTRGVCGYIVTAGCDYRVSITSAITSKFNGTYVIALAASSRPRGVETSHNTRPAMLVRGGSL
jgi:hypothetical protein